MWDQSNIIINLQKKFHDLVSAVDDKFDKMLSFSGSETVIGTFDGKTLYRKIINVEAMPNNTTKYVSLGLNNVQVIRAYGYAVNSTGNTFLLPHVDSVNVASQISMYITSTNYIAIMTGSNRSDYSGYVVVEYYKKPATRDTDPDPTEDDHK